MMMNFDAVVVGSVLTIVGCVLVLGILVFKAWRKIKGTHKKR